MEDEESLEDKVKQPNRELVFCDFKDCPQFGEYIRCYFDLYKNCPKYLYRKFSERRSLKNEK